MPYSPVSPPQPQPHLHSHTPLPRSMALYVKTLFGQSVSVEADLYTDPAGQVKYEACETTGYHPDDARFIVGGKALDPKLSMRANGYGIQDHSSTVIPTSDPTRLVSSIVSLKATLKTLEKLALDPDESGQRPALLEEVARLTGVISLRQEHLRTFHAAAARKPTSAHRPTEWQDDKVAIDAAIAASLECELSAKSMRLSTRDAVSDEELANIALAVKASRKQRR